MINNPAIHPGADVMSAHGARTPDGGEEPQFEPPAARGHDPYQTV